MLRTVFEVLAGLAAAAGVYGVASWVARGYTKKHHELIAKRLGKGREDDASTSGLPIHADVKHYEPANTQDDEQYPAEPADK